MEFPLVVQVFDGKGVGMLIGKQGSMYIDAAGIVSSQVDNEGRIDIHGYGPLSQGGDGDHWFAGRYGCYRLMANAECGHGDY